MFTSCRSLWHSCSMLSITLIASVTLTNIAAAQNSSATESQQKAPPELKPGDVELTKSVALVYVGATGLGHPHGVEGHLAYGHVTLGAAQSAGLIVFDMKSFVAETSLARQYVGLSGEIEKKTAETITKNMRDEVLSVDKFPQATFEITSALPQGAAEAGKPQQFVLDGQLTLHGVKQPLKLLVQAEQVQGWTHLRGGFAILQSKFGITPLSKALGAIGVADELKIWGDFWLR